ncbi:MAG: tRNA pseudouridine(38-40) synthase TruA [Bacilli bacterium]|nr:tRNA pseudouridine(38-40) synthase TruA [Bacilli bacterium]
MTYSYDGTNFSGYQKQPRKRTIQKEIEDVLKQINGGKKVTIYSSGRTDAGVHALNQKAHFEMNVKISADRLLRGMNSLLPSDIYVKNIEIVEDDFHARFNAIGKEYIYIINMGEYNPIERNYVYQYCKKLDVVSIERGLKYLEGTHNYKSFVKCDEEITDYERTISQATVIRDSKDLNKIIITFVGTGFLRYMVRNMVGLLIEIGEGKRKPENIIEILKSENRRLAGKTAPSCGLYLRNVFY